FYCMKFIRGRDLGELLSLLRRGDEETRRSYGRVRLLSIFQAVCHGMAYAHERGVIHRDLKPRNIMLGEHGEVSIVDSGLAKTVSKEDEPLLASDSSERLAALRIAETVELASSSDETRVRFHGDSTILRELKDPTAVSTISVGLRAAEKSSD